MEAGAPAVAPAAAETPAAPSNGSVTAAPASNGAVAKPPPAPDAQEKITVKVNGKLRTLTREEAIREIQKSGAARENFEKAANLTKKNQTLLRALQDPDPGRQDAALRELGVDPDRIVERRLAIRAQQAQMSPEQQRIAELEQQLQAKERAAKEAQEQAEHERTAAQERQIWQETEAKYLSVVDAALKAGEFSGMSPAEALYYMADAAEMNLAYGLDIPPEELVGEVKARFAETRDEFRAKITGALDGPALLEYLGPDAVNKVLRAAVAKFKGGGAPAQPLETPATIAEAPDAPPKRQWKRPSDIKTTFL
jgi:hypothetical protein